MNHRRPAPQNCHSILSGLKIFRFWLILVIGLCVGCSESPDPEATNGDAELTGNEASSPVPRDVTLALNWYPEAEHGGYYAALVHGYFKEAGLNVTIRPGGPGVPVIQDVATGRVEFGISNADQILVGRAREADVVAVFAALQTSPRCIMVHEASGIETFEGLKNLTLAINQNSTFGNYLQRQVSLEGCTIVPYPGNVSTFLLNKDFAQQAYVFSEPFTAKKEGGDPRSLMAAEIGFNPYTSTLITEASMIKDKPDLVRDFTQAVQKGWQKYLTEPEETNRFILAQTDEMNDEDLDILEFGAKELQALCLSIDSTGTIPLGHMTEARWQKMADQLVECEVVETGSLNVADAFTNDFLAKPQYKESESDSD